MITPRNTIVIVKILPNDPLKQVGAIVVLENNELYGMGEIVAVGPGTKSAEGGVSETFDLKPGQVVWLKYKDRIRTQIGFENKISGVQYRDGAQTFHAFEQSNILGIVEQPASN